jgi:hypothetical protein
MRSLDRRYALPENADARGMSEPGRLIESMSISCCLTGNKQGSQRVSAVDPKHEDGWAPR